MGGSIPADLIDAPLDFDGMSKLGAPIGAGGLLLMDEDTDMVEVARYLMDFLVKESCGKCVPCREGMQQMLQILTRLAEGQGRKGDLELLKEPEELALIKSLLQFPELVESCAITNEPHRLADYLAGMAGLFHFFYHKHRIVTEDPSLTGSRLVLCRATQIVLRNGLTILGVSAPEQM